MNWKVKALNSLSRDHSVQIVPESAKSTNTFNSLSRDHYFHNVEKRERHMLMLSTPSLGITRIRKRILRLLQ